MSRFLNELEARNLLSKSHIPMAKSLLAATKEEANDLLKDMEFPIVMKILSSDILHKTEAGCVFVGVKEEEAEDLYDTIISNAKRYKSDAKIDGVLLQEMAPKGLEVIIGMKRDPQFGPVIMAGTGGIYVEVFEDVALRVLPLDKAEIERMLLETKLIKVIRGARGTKYDEEVLIDIIYKIANLVEENPDIEEIDINPMFLYENGAKGVDALIKLK